MGKTGYLAYIANNVEPTLDEYGCASWSKFFSCRSIETADKLVVQESLLSNSIAVMLEQVGPPVIHLPLFRVPSYIPDDDLQVVLRVYSTILRITHPTYKDRHCLFTGTRVLLMEMAKEMPTFVYVAGNPVFYEYKGMKRVCLR